MEPTHAPRGRITGEGRILLLIGAVQFVNVLDFMMVMPLGPDFARALGIETARLGMIGGSYTAAAAVSGVLGAFVLDRLDRRTALVLALAGLVLGTAAGGLAVDFRTLLLARVVAGAFGGPATALSLAIVTDVVPPERRGRAMGAVMGAFSVASIFGVPVGLELARLGGWRLPFFAVAGLGAVVAALAAFVLPPLRAHLAAAAAAPARRDAGGLGFLATPTILASLGATAVAMFGNFALIPNLSAYVQENLGYPRDRLGMLYLVGGMCSFVAMRVAGRLADRKGPALVAAVGSSIYVPIVAAWFIAPVPFLPVLAMFSLFMVSGSFRVVPMHALASRVPDADQRARFMSAQSAVQHMASASGAMLGSEMLGTLPDGKLEGMDRVAWLAVVLSFVLPALLFWIQGQVGARDRARERARLEGPARYSSPEATG